MQSGRTSRDVYQLDHAVLNIQPPKTMWLNMGYWKVCLHLLSVDFQILSDFHS